MRFPRVRFTVRQVLVAVALLAVLLAVVIRRRDYCLRMAARHAQQEARERADSWSTRSARSALNARMAVAARHAELSSRYRRVASRPWESLPDDPYLNTRRLLISRRGVPKRDSIGTLPQSNQISLKRPENRPFTRPAINVPGHHPTVEFRDRLALALFFVRLLREGQRVRHEAKLGRECRGPRIRTGPGPASRS